MKERTIWSVNIPEMLSDIRCAIEDGVEHCEICNEVSEKFGLWDRDDCSPAWLDREVAKRLSHYTRT